MRPQEIFLRADLTTCERLPPLALDERRAPAADPDLGDILAGQGFAGDASPIEAAAGDYARAIQLRERADADARDIEQTLNNRALCEKLHELDDLVTRNNRRAAGSDD